MDIAVVNCSVYLTLDSKGGTVKDVRIVLGAVAPTPVRARPAEEFLKGKNPDQETIRETANRAAEFSKPIDDVRSSAHYRCEMVRVLTRRALQEAVKRARGKG
jgi:carbon-monoxide dehydrogenase medium subunit